MHISDPVKNLRRIFLQPYMNAVNYFCRMFLTFLWVSGSELCCVEEYFGWVELNRQSLWLRVDRWRCILSGWEWVDIFYGWVGEWA